MSGTIRRQATAPLAAMVEIIEQRSLYMAEHSERVSWWAQRLARHLALGEEEVDAIGLAAKLHDLGKAILPSPLDAKPGPLTPEEWVLVRQHPDIGANIVAHLPGFETIAQYIRYHHERHDGKGYPKGLRGDEIPLGARILAVADAFDAMVSDRAYRPALSPIGALAQVHMNMGTQFDPRVASALLALVQADRSSPVHAALRPEVTLASPLH